MLLFKQICLFYGLNKSDFFFEINKTFRGYVLKQNFKFSFYISLLKQINITFKSFLLVTMYILTIVNQIISVNYKNILVISSGQNVKTYPWCWT